MNEAIKMRIDAEDLIDSFADIFYMNEGKKKWGELDKFMSDVYQYRQKYQTGDKPNNHNVLPFQTEAVNLLNRYVEINDIENPDTQVRECAFLCIHLIKYHNRKISDCSGASCQASLM